MLSWYRIRTSWDTIKRTKLIEIRNIMLLHYIIIHNVRAFFSNTNEYIWGRNAKSGWTILYEELPPSVQTKEEISIRVHSKSVLFASTIFKVGMTQTRDISTLPPPPLSNATRAKSNHSIETRKIAIYAIKFCTYSANVSDHGRWLNCRARTKQNAQIGYTFSDLEHTHDVTNDWQKM
jgi:hypothetical protein